MTVEAHTDETDAQDLSVDDSPIIKALRSQIRDLEKAVKSAPTRESIEAELRNELVREKAITEQLVALGHPAGMAAVLKGRLGETEVTADAVADALRNIGYQVGEASVPEGDGAGAPAQSELAKVASLSAQVASAAGGASSVSVTERINQAKNQDELNAIMGELGLLS